MRNLVPALLCVAACSTPATPSDVRSSDGTSDIDTIDAPATGDAPDTGLPGTDASDVTDAAVLTPADFNVSGYIGIVCMGNAPISSCRVSASFSFSDSASMAVDPISVTVNGQALAHPGAGTFLGDPLAYASSYDLVITRATETIVRRFVLPDDYSVSLTPAMPAPNTPSTLTWTPANEPNVRVTTTFLSGPTSPFNGSGDDNGMLAVPADAFPTAGDYLLEFQRRINYGERNSPYTWQTGLAIARRIPISVR